jgi:hypothetical protein
MDDAEAAVLLLRETFKTFCFADAEMIRAPQLGLDLVNLESRPGLDESSYLAGLLTAVCRPSLHLAPGLLARAPDISGAGTGKGLACKAACVIASGVRPIAFTQGHNEEEFDKRLSTALIQARPAVYLDNVNRVALRSDTLASALSERPASIRIFGQTKDKLLNSSAFIVVTGNGLQITEDLARRFIEFLLDARVEDPESRPFKDGASRFLENILAKRGELLGAILTIWRWGRQNKERLTTGKPLGSYEVWAEWCRDPLLTLGCRDPVERIAETKKSDPHRRHVIEVFEAWSDRHGGERVKASELVEEVQVRICPEERGRRQRVAAFLNRTVGTRAGGYVLRQYKNETLSRPVATYWLEQTEGNT